MPVRYSFTGEWKEYNTLLRKYQLSGLLKRIAGLSNDILYDKRKDKFSGMIVRQCRLMEATSMKVRQQDVYITGWGLIDMAYHAIISSNDYRGKQVESEDELHTLVLADKAFMEKEESKLLDQIGNDYEFFFYLWGFAGEQFKIQELSRIFDNAGRELYILLDIAPRIRSIDIAAVIQQETGVSWEALCKSLFFAWVGFSNEPTLESLKAIIQWNDELTEGMFNKVVARYSASYGEIQESLLKRQFLYTHPYIETQKDGVIGINSFLNLFLYEHAVLWAARDFYQRKKDQRLTSEFGRMFEEYFRELIYTYIDETDIYRIPEENTERADWRLTIGGHKFLVEQKSTIARLAAKQQNSDYKAIIDFSNKTLIKALNQLETTQKEQGEGPYIKIVLLYDDFINSNLIDEAFKMPECNVCDDGLYWLVNIETMERFLALSARDSVKCDEIIKEKMRLDAEHSVEGRSLDYLLNKAVGHTNEYLKKEKINKFIKCTEIACREMLPKST